MPQHPRPLPSTQQLEEAVVNQVLSWASTAARVEADLDKVLAAAVQVGCDPLRSTLMADMCTYIWCHRLDHTYENPSACPGVHVPTLGGLSMHDSAAWCW